MAEIPLQSILANGAELIEGAAAAGDTAQVGSNKFLVVRNGSAGAVTVTLAVPGTDFTGVARPDMAVAIPAGKTRVFPLLEAYGDPAASIPGQAVVTYSATATVFRSVIATY